MEKFAIWKDQKVIGYIELTEVQRQALNGMHGIDVYFGYDKVTKPEMYSNSENKKEIMKL